jgi:UMF1 family MFS transporter
MSDAIAETAAPTASGRGKPASALGQLGWVLYDASRSPYGALIMIFVFSAYFVTQVASDPLQGQITWSYVSAAASFVIALGAPLMGAIADAGGRRKPWLAVCVIFGAPAMAALWFATPGMTDGLGWIILALVIAACVFEFSNMFLNSLLPSVAGEKRIGLLSGMGLGLGNALSIALFIFFLFAWSWNPNPLFGLNVAAHEPERAVGPIAGLCYALFSLPFFFVTPDAPGSGLSPAAAARQGLKSLAGTLGKLKRYKTVTTFLIARMVYNEGIVVLIVFTGVFAAGILKWTPDMLIVQGVANSVAAALGGFGAGWLDQKIGSRNAAVVGVAGCLATNCVLLGLTPTHVFWIEAPLGDGGLFPKLSDKVFFVAVVFTAFFGTAALVNSRALLAKISPRAMLTEFFGLFALSGTATSFVGPLAIGIVTQAFHEQRAGVAVGVMFFVVGLALLFRVKEGGPADA